MISASLYIIVCTAKNRLWRRLRRLREPRYLVGAIVGAAYLYFTFFARARGRAAADAARRRNAPRSDRAAPSAIAATLVAAGPGIVGIVFLVLAIVAWVLPFDSGLLEFSEAETDWLFPAPITRRQLLMYRLLRSQIGILFGSAIVAFASPASAGSMRLRISLGTWIVFVTMKVYFTAVTLVRGRLRMSPTAWVPLAALTAALAITAAGLARAFIDAPVASVPDALTRIAVATSAGAVSVALWPFAALARPVFAASAAAFLPACAVSMLILAAAIVWMLRSDEAFQDAAAFAAARRAQRRQDSRAPSVRTRASGLSLALTGPPELALGWKNGVQTLRLTGFTAIRIGVALTAVVVAASTTLMRALHLRGGAAAACAIAIGGAAFNAVLGPQVVRTDLRSDLLHLELLKTWPVRPAAMIRGELAWPGTFLTLIGWAAIACAAAFSTAAFPQLTPATRASLTIAAIVLTPAFVFAQYLVQNAAALAFPAWVPLGNQRPRGLDAMGQRLIMLAGVLASVIVLMLPGAIAGGILWLAFQRWVGVAIVVPAALVCTTIVLLEVLVATELLAPLYERLDILAVERAE